MSPDDSDSSKRFTPRWSVRTLLLLTVTVGLGIGWWLSRRELHALHEKIIADGNAAVALLLQAANESENNVERQALIEAAEVALSVLHPPKFEPLVKKRDARDAFTQLHEDIMMAKRNFEKESRLLTALSAMQVADSAGDREKLAEIKMELLREFPDVQSDRRFNKY